MSHWAAPQTGLSGHMGGSARRYKPIGLGHKCHFYDGILKAGLPMPCGKKFDYTKNTTNKREEVTCPGCLEALTKKK